MNQDEINKKRNEAKEAMIRPEQKERLEKKEETIEKKRKEAMLAMEGFERKRRREIKEAEEKEREWKKKQEELNKNKEADEIRKQQQEEEEKKRRMELEKEETLEKRIQTAHEREKIITQLKKSRETNLSAVRTFRSDLANATKEGALTMAQIALKEAGKKEVEKNMLPKITAVVLTVLLLIGGSLIAYYAFINQNKDTAIPIPPPVTSLIFAENENEIEVDSINRTTLIAEIAKRRETIGQGGTITNIFFSKTLGTEAEPVKVFSSIPDLLKILDINALDEVVGNTSPEFMYGMFHEGANIPFLILKTSNYENLVAAVLNNEHRIPTNLSVFLGATNRASGTTAYEFRDRIIKNYDTRVIENNFGDPIFIYSFINRETLIITKGERAFSEITKRFQDKGVI